MIERGVARRPPVPTSGTRGLKDVPELWCRPFYRNHTILTEDGVLIRELTIDPTWDYQPQQPAPIGHYHLRQTGTMS